MVGPSGPSSGPLLVWCEVGAAAERCVAADKARLSCRKLPKGVLGFTESRFAAERTVLRAQVGGDDVLRRSSSAELTCPPKTSPV